jgi:hypothetical protein
MFEEASAAAVQWIFHFLSRLLLIQGKKSEKKGMSKQNKRQGEIKVQT